MNKKISLSYALLLGVLLLVGCGTKNISLNVSKPVITIEPEPIVEPVENTSYVGLTIKEAEVLAEKSGVSFRVVEKDGEPLMVTMDFRPGRINAAVKNGVVNEYEVEGENITYDQNSWKEIIPETCKSFFDGCNTCNRASGSDMAACTRKACQNYEKPTCLDTEEKALEE